MHQKFIARLVATVVVVVALCSVPAASQTRISGVVNQYVQVTDIVPCDSLVRLGNPSGFVEGDRVLLIQMKGATISSTDDAAYGTISDINGAGSAELLTIKSVEGEIVVFTTRLSNRYSPTGSVQLVRVPVYQDATIDGELTAPAWNGTTGGVVAIEVTGNLYLRANINVDGLGFRGGVVSQPISRCNITSYVMNWAFGQAGGKGEGITIGRISNQALAGRGPLANGGGGGNGNNAGGAGGGNGGVGGMGGDANLYCAPNLMVGGLPGKNLSTFVKDQRFFLGGGGGGGHQNDFQGTSGASGGGIVILRAGLLHGNGYRITANGSRVADTADMDAAGGGGAGGTILLDVGAIASPVFATAHGGDGGNIKHQYNAHGPGGGGGGGVVVITEQFPNVTIDLLGGIPGTHTNPTNEAYRQNRNAAVGQEGVLVTNFSWKTPLSVKLEAWGGGPICEAVTSVVMEATPGFEDYVWSDGQTGRAIVVTTPGTYSVTAVDAGGCEHTATGVQAWYNTTEFSMPTVVDFGPVSLETSQRRTIPIRNEDDEDIVLSRVDNAANFRVVSPAGFPVVIPAGCTLPVIIEFYAAYDQEFIENIMFVFDKPCPDSQNVQVRAIVSPIWATFHIPDLTATVGDTAFEIPLYVDVRPDTAVLRSTHLKISLTMDSRVFNPSRVTRGTIVTNMIDLLTNTRTLTIELDSIDLLAQDNYVTSIVGAPLMAVQHETLIEPQDAEWVRVWQVPITDYSPGLIKVNPVCFQEGRLIKIFTMPTLSVAPNPVSQEVTVSALFSVPGAYTIKVVNMEGTVVHESQLWHQQQTDQDQVVSIATAEWPSGLYVVQFVTPLVTHTQKLVVRH